MNDGLLLQWIQTCVEDGHYYVTEHAMTSHTNDEGFRVRHALRAIERGTIIAHRPEEDRCLICGDVPELHSLPEYHGSFLHVVIEYRQALNIVIITIYRPSRADWETPTMRRRSSPRYQAGEEAKGGDTT